MADEKTALLDCLGVVLKLREDFLRAVAKACPDEEMARFLRDRVMTITDARKTLLEEGPDFVKEATARYGDIVLEELCRNDEENSIN